MSLLVVGYFPEKSTSNGISQAKMTSPTNRTRRPNFSKVSKKTFSYHVRQGFIAKMSRKTDLVTYQTSDVILLTKQLLSSMLRNTLFYGLTVNTGGYFAICVVIEQ